MPQVLTRYYRLFLIAILAWSFFTRMYNLHLPEKYVFDEVYHALTSKLIARNDVRAFEWWNPPVEPDTAVDWLHPPLAKYTQALGMLAFGENSFGWRISSVVFGVLVIAAVFKVADLAFKSKPLALTAALIASFDGLLLVQSRIAMNDIHVTFFILLTMIMYFHYLARRQSWIWLLATGISAGLAVASKWSGVFILGLVGISETIHLLKTIIQAVQKHRFQLWPVIRQLALLFSYLILVPVCLYILAYSQMFLQGKNLDHLYKLHQQIWWYQTGLEATHSYQSRPWQWALDARPVWYYVDYASNERIGNIYAFGNPVILWLGLAAAVVTLIFIGWLVYRRRQLPWHLILILAAYLIVWTPWQLSPRIMFFYHYTPAVPFLCILLAYWLRFFWRKQLRIIVWAVLLAMGSVFAIWYPLWTGIPVPITFADHVYFVLKTWK